MKSQNNTITTWQSEPKTNSDLPNWISWDKDQGNYCLIFEDKISKETMI